MDCQRYHGRPQPLHARHTLRAIRHNVPDYAAASHGQHALPYLPVTNGSITFLVDIFSTL